VVQCVTTRGLGILIDRGAREIPGLVQLTDNEILCSMGQDSSLWLMRHLQVGNRNLAGRTTEQLTDSPGVANLTLTDEQS